MTLQWTSAIGSFLFLLVCSIAFLAAGERWWVTLIAFVSALAGLGYIVVLWRQQRKTLPPGRAA